MKPAIRNFKKRTECSCFFAAKQQHEKWQEQRVEAMKTTKKYNTSDKKTVFKMPVEECRNELARLSKGLAHPARVEILKMLAGRPPRDKCVCGDIVDALPLAQSTVSQHLKVLKETGWIQGEIDRPRICYCLIDGILEYYLELVTRCVNQAVH